MDDILIAIPTKKDHSDSAKPDASIKNIWAEGSTRKGAAATTMEISRNQNNGSDHKQLDSQHKFRL